MLSSEAMAAAPQWCTVGTCTTAHVSVGVSSERFGDALWGGRRWRSQVVFFFFVGVPRAP